MARMELANQAAAGVVTPSSGNTTLFVDSDKLLKSKDDTGTVQNYGAPGTAITSLTSEVTASGPGAAAATLLNSAVIGKILTGLTLGTGTVLSTDTILQAFGKLLNKGNASCFPAATDGNATISSDTTLTKDMFYDTLTVNLGSTLFTNGFRIFARTAIVCNGSIDRSGNNATGIAATAALTAGSVGVGTAGGAGGTAAGAAGGASATSLGGAGGAGGATGSAGGAGGANTLNTAANGGVESFQIYDNARTGRNVAGTQVTYGSGGGGGAGDGTAGGAGGGGGGLVILITPSLTGSGTIRVKGGDGFQPIAGNRGGGGGGGGGILAICTENDVTMTSLILNTAGGVGASGFGTGASGINGSTGRTFLVRV